MSDDTSIITSILIFNSLYSYDYEKAKSKKYTDEKELEFVKSKLSEVSIIFIDIIDILS